jgi:hypothetical protein
MYRVCERLSIDYTFGIAANSVLKKLSASLLEQAQANFAATGQPQRLFDAFWYRADQESRSSIFGRLNAVNPAVGV